MKRVLAGMIAALFFTMMPFISFAKKIITESELDGITAQEGVTVDFSCPTYTYSTISGSVMVENFAPTLSSLGDGNGFGTYNTTGWTGVGNITMGSASNIIVYNKMTIDVGSSGTVTRMNVGLPSIFVHPVNTDAIMKLGTQKNLSTPGATGGVDQIMGSLYNDKFALIVNPLWAVGPTYQGSIMMGNHASDNTQGIEQTFNNFYLGIPSEAIDMTWGDRDGFTTGGFTGAGYVGMENYLHYNGNMMGAIGTSMMLVQMDGTSSIDVGTSGTLTQLYMVLPKTTVNPNFAGGCANMTATLVLSRTKDLASGVQPLATAYMEGVQPVTQGSFALFAH